MRRLRTCATAAARSSSANCPAARTTTWPCEHGFKPLSAEEATRKADLINILLPDEIQGDVYRQHIAQQPRSRATC